MIVGKTARGGTSFPLAADTKRVARFEFTADQLVTKLSAYLDGLGVTGTGQAQVARAVIYDQAGALIAQGSEVLIPSSAPVGWYDFPFAPAGGGARVTAGFRDLGLIVGGLTNLIRIKGDASSDLGGRWNPDIYTDGADNPFGGPQLCTNPSFETDTNGWDASASWWLNAGATFSRVDGGTAGAKALRVVGNGSTAGEGVRYIDLPVVAGKTYEIAVDVALESGSAGLALSAGASGVGTAQLAFTATAGYQRKTLLYTATGTGSAQVAVSINAAAASTFLIDNISIVTPGQITVVASDLSIFATGAPVYEPPDDETDFYYSRLPMPEAQAELGEETPAPNVFYLARVGWHHTSLDPEWGSFAVVNGEGPLIDLLGERVKVTVKAGTVERSVVCYVHNYGELDDDISLTRRCFFSLGLLAEDSLQATVEVLV